MSEAQTANGASTVAETKTVLLDNPKELVGKTGKMHLRIDTGNHMVRLSVNSADGTTSHKLNDCQLGVGRQLRVKFKAEKNARAHDLTITRGAAGISVTWQGFIVEDAKKISLSPPGVWQVMSVKQEATPLRDVSGPRL